MSLLPGEERGTQMTYEEVVDQINQIRRFGNLAGVEVAGRMLKALGSPQAGIPLIHIAGTNGKGSVSAFLCAILREAGLRVGMFTSPHLVDFRERIQINGKMISKGDTQRIGVQLLAMDFGVQPTMFDVTLAMAILYFKEQRCDVMILETGLGGRLDATNAVGVPDVTVITKIGYDHMAVLGNTLAEIAAEKTGIIKKGTSLVLESQEAEVMTVFEAKVREEGITDFRLIDPLEIKEQTYRDGRQYFSFGAYRDLSMRMLGVHQYENAVAALLGAEAFFRRHTEWICGGTKEREEGVRRAVCQGIAKTVWKGRMEILSKKPFLLVDGAHNSNGVEALRESLVALFPGEKFHFIMGVMADKDYETMIGELLPLAIDFTTCTVECERALQADALADCIRRKGIAAASADDFASCFQRGRLDETHRTVAFGSLYFIGEIEALFEAK